jgi:hypothetical protein
MLEPSITTKIAPDALALLRRVAQATGEKQIRVLTRLLEAEAARLARPTKAAPRQAAR